MIPSANITLSEHQSYLMVRQVLPGALTANALAVQTAYREYQQRALERDGLRRTLAEGKPLLSEPIIGPGTEARLLLTVPLAVIGVVLFRSLSFLDAIIKVDIPGLGLVILLSAVTFIGYIGSTVLYQPIADFGHEVLPGFQDSVFEFLMGL